MCSPMDLKSVTQIALQTVQRHEYQPRPERDRTKLMSSLIIAYRSNVHDMLKVGSIGVYDRWIVTLKEIPYNVFKVSMQDIEQHRNQELSREVRLKSELTDVIEMWYEKIDWWRWRLSMWRLEAGKQYRVIQNFKDFDDNTFETAELLTFVGQSSVPYHGGYTLKFKERSISLQEMTNAEFINQFDTYLEESS